MWEVDFCNCGEPFGGDWTEEYETESQVYAGIETMLDVASATVQSVRTPTGESWDWERRRPYK